MRVLITGLTGFRQVDIGNIVNAAAQTGIVTITQIEPISVIFTAPEEQLQDINRAIAAGPLPVIARISTPCSAAIRFATGVALVSRSSPLPAEGATG